MFQNNVVFGMLNHCNHSELGPQLPLLESSFGQNTTEHVALQFLEDTPFLKVMGLCCVVIGLTCLVLNLFTFTYYCNVKKQMFGRVYRSLTMCDLVNGAAAVLMGCNLVYYCTWDARTFSTNPPGIVFTKLVVSVSCLMSRVGVWNNLLLAILRTQTVAFPSCIIPNKALNLLLTLQPLCWCVVIISDITLEHHTGLPVLYYIRYDVIKAMLGRTTVLKLSFSMCLLPPPLLVWGVVLVIPFVLPVLLALPLMMGQVYCLMFRNRHISAKSTRSRKMTVTIIYLTSVYILCNSVYFIAIVTNSSQNSDSPPYENLLFLTSTVVPYLHSTINAAILISRGRSLQNYCLSVLDRYLYRCRRREAPHRDCAEQASHKNMTTWRQEKEVQNGVQHGAGTVLYRSGGNDNCMVDRNHISVDKRYHIHSV